MNVNISMNSVKDVRELVDAANMSKSKVTLTSGKYVIDAKSIMAVFTLDLNQPIGMTVEPEPDDRFKKAVEKFIVS